MTTRHSHSVFKTMLLAAIAAAVSACQHPAAVDSQPAPEIAASAAPAPGASPVPEAAVTREKASTDCWMKYEKEGRGLSLDQRLPLVEKCTADRLKAASR